MPKKVDMEKYYARMQRDGGSVKLPGSTAAPPPKGKAPKVKLAAASKTMAGRFNHLLPAAQIQQGAPEAATTANSPEAMALLIVNAGRKVRGLKPLQAAQRAQEPSMAALDPAAKLAAGIISAGQRAVR